MGIQALNAGTAYTLRNDFNAIEKSCVTGSCRHSTHAILHVAERVRKPRALSIALDGRPELPFAKRVLVLFA